MTSSSHFGGFSSKLLSMTHLSQLTFELRPVLCGCNDFLPLVLEARGSDRLVIALGYGMKPIM